ncbi:MAG: CapA family protein [Chloroflexota bacterium]
MKSPQKLRLLCIGDVAICEDLSTTKRWPPPADLKPDETSHILFNFELPVGSKLNPAPRNSGPRFLAHPAAVDILKNWAPGFATLANNHILDGEAEGLKTTYDQLSRASFKPIGAGFRGESHRELRVWETALGSLAILNWVFPETHPDWDKNPGANCWQGLEHSRRMIFNLKKEVDWILVVLHWSDELFAFPRPEDRLTAAALAEQGAGIIVGHHPHVVRGWEMMGNCPVFYSLGDFYFSNIRASDGKWLSKEAPLNRESLGVELLFCRGEKPQIRLHSFWQVERRTISDPLRRAERRLAHLSHPLHNLRVEEYPIWYHKKRRWFDQVGYRLHFRRYQITTNEMMQIIVRNMRRMFTLSTK